MRRTNYPEHEVNKLNWHVLKLVYPYLLEFKWRISLAIVCLILAKVASVYLPFVLKDVVDTLDKNVENKVMLVPFGLVAAYGLARLSVVLFGEIRDTLFGRVTERAIRRIGLKVFEHLHSLELAFHLNRQTGGISRDIDRGNSGIAFLMRFMVFNIVPTLLEIIMVIGVFLINYHWGFAAITATSIAIYISYTVYATEWRTGFIRAANKADSSSNTRAIDSLLNYETVKFFNNEAYEAKMYDEQLATWEKAKTQNRLSLFALNGGQATIVAIAMTSMLALAAYQVTNEQMTLGDFVLINAFMMQLFMPLNFLGFVYREIKGSLANIEGMFGLLDKKPQITDKPEAPDLTISQSGIEFNNVTFGYHHDRQVLKGVSFSVNAGQKVAIVGESGSGKSTIVKLLFRFYDTDGGTITIDEQNITDVTQLSLRKHIGIVPQDTVLFNDTIFENVRYGRPHASDSEVRKAISMAYLDDLIAKLPDGENTQVGERGLKLSGGEKQRVAIARTLLKNPEIWIFDEATSALDSHAEQEILKAIRSVAKNKTSIVIAHRLSTITDADTILVMLDGKIVEKGSHSELIAAQGRYYSMWQLQQKS
ncbi:ABC transporter ATP-binding protein/permease [Thalassotalea sp. LPB0316]|uniref:ABCB family ABC transporter ATP-binding protein/permease n=1 Tax=Thalassotalea sp. LPB0316 TaxID=2769490 RepID=UPI0018691474|nr:ABC transporter ATP-binding protein/permease [Thalassotalea sp. LPB0316]QOL25057.1 ABC transporter ATP-binding protein/permease [Thalassotalea sp. LPB0316]